MLTRFLLLILSFLITTSSIRAEEPITEPDPVTSLVGMALGTPVSMIAGMARGSLSKSIEYAGEFPQSMGDGMFSHLVGVPGGALVGLFTGGITGLLRGTFNGVINGIDYPFTAKSVSLDGKFLDYEPYEILPASLK